MANTYDIERAVLSSLMFDDGTLQKHVSVEESFFTTDFNRIVAKTFNALKDKNRPTDEYTIRFYLDKSGLLNDVLFDDILCANPFGSVNSITHYVGILKSERMARFAI